MRILNLEINDYKMFKDKNVFELGKERHLLIGINGSGKSTILEAVAIIFSQFKNFCEKKESYKKIFPFKIEYTLNNREILEETSTTLSDKLSINTVSLSNNEGDYKMNVDNEQIDSIEEMYKYLPDNLIFYYAGACNTLEEIIDKTEDEQAEDLYRKTNNKNIARVIESITKNIVYIRKDYYPLLFALNYIDKDLTLPLTESNFEINSIRFYVKQYKFTNNKNYKDLYKLSGFLRVFMDNLLLHSFDGVEFDETNKIAFFEVGLHRGILEAIENLPNLTDDLKYNKTRFLAFHFISLLYRIGFIKKIEIIINDAKSNTYSINDLSEGEQQLIILQSIKNNLCHKNSIVFLDEPDAYLHPKRQRELFPYLNEFFIEDFTQIITTTHSPFIAQSFDLDEILLLNNIGNRIDLSESDVASYSAISEQLFGIHSEFNTDIETDFNKFKQIRQSIFKDEAYNKTEFRDLTTKLLEYNEETKIIVVRELNQLKRLKDFDLNE